MSKLKKFIIWDDDAAIPFSSGIYTLCSFEVKLGNEYILTEDIENFVEGAWSSFVNDQFSCRAYFFELESDAMAFKLRWL